MIGKGLETKRRAINARLILPFKSRGAHPRQPLLTLYSGARTGRETYRHYPLDCQVRGTFQSVKSSGGELKANAFNIAKLHPLESLSSIAIRGTQPYGPNGAGRGDGLDATGQCTSESPMIQCAEAV
jgi:hypothetical protein